MIDVLAMHGDTLLVLAIAFGFLMAFGIGANDVANAMGTSVGSKALTIKQAIVIAMIFEFCGAYFAGGEVTSTIRKGIIDVDLFVHAPEILVFGMTASLLAAGLWLILASFLGWPVSTTHSIVGAIIGFASFSLGVDAVMWSQVGGIVSSWIVTPFISGMIAFFLFMTAQKLIFDTPNPLEAAKRYIPYYMALAGFILSLETIMKGFKHVGFEISTLQSFVIASCVAFSLAMLGKVLIRMKDLKHDKNDTREAEFKKVEQVFAILMIITACCMTFAHGSNDVANAIGPLAAVASTIKYGAVTAESHIAWWILPMGGLGIVIGLAVYGHRVIATIGSGITHLTPSRGFAAELATAMTVIIASGTGLPISTTQTLVGAVLGVGMARGIAALNLGVVRNIVVSWVVTLPAGAFLSILFYLILRWSFSPTA